MCKALGQPLETHTATGVMPGPSRPGSFPACLRGQNAAAGDGAGGDGRSG